LIDKVVRLGRSARRRSDAADAAKLAVEYQQIVRPACIAIGSSTGGIPPIYEIIRNIDPALECPIFITQHLPEAFMTFFARQLDGLTTRTVKVAEPGEIVKNNHIYIAPGDAHLVCRRERKGVVLEHLTHYSGSRYCPSVDAMFQSLAKAFGAGSMGIILSGMGNDGSAGARCVADAGGSVLVQDVDSSVVWGMPGAAAREGIATAILTPQQMTELLGQVAKAA
jgi:two-component system, chemotaxis family, protein-glutamate methylesterase/glutaminase